MTRIPFDQQMATLADFGIVPNAGFDEARVLENFDRDDIECCPYQYVLATLATNDYCDKAWAYGADLYTPDTSFASMLERLAAMTERFLRIENIHDDFGVFGDDKLGPNRVVLEFDVGGDAHSWDCFYKSGYTDYNFVGRYNELLEQHQCPLRIYWDGMELLVAIEHSRFDTFREAVKQPDFDLELCAFDKERLEYESSMLD